MSNHFLKRAIIHIWHFTKKVFIPFQFGIMITYSWKRILILYLCKKQETERVSIIERYVVSFNI